LHYYLVLFFFSSRRRHTRWPRDWSSDVCSSDLHRFKLTASRAQWIYKKVDSVLRGHLLVELEAMMDQLGLNRALLVPANPSLERVVRNGQYFVRGKPIHETDFRLDPEYPRYTSSVGELLGASGARSVHVCGT